VAVHAPSQGGILGALGNPGPRSALAMRDLSRIARCERAFRPDVGTSQGFKEVTQAGSSRSWKSIQKMAMPPSPLQHEMTNTSERHLSFDVDAATCGQPSQTPAKMLSLTSWRS